MQTSTLDKPGAIAMTISMSRDTSSFPLSPSRRNATESINQDVGQWNIWKMSQRFVSGNVIGIVTVQLKQRDGLSRAGERDAWRVGIAIIAANKKAAGSCAGEIVSRHMDGVAHAMRQ